MNLDLVFNIINTIALASWIILIFFLTKPWVGRYILNLVIALMAILYGVVIFQALGGEGDFSSLKGVMTLFADEKAVLAGWIHYLAFDLMVGLYIVNNSQKIGINRLIIIPCLALTFMFGPLGLLLYILIRSIYTKKLFNDYL